MRRFVFVLILLSLSASATKLDSVVQSQISSAGGEKIPVIVLLKNHSTRTASIASSYRPTHTYSVIPGFSAELTTGELLELEKNPSVERIFHDGAKQIAGDYEIALGYSVPTIGASYAHSALNITGRNVTVAVIDTGIDYNHPDLGGCFGSGCRVRGGYDFVDNDSNPMDTNNHGTHCAGIIGANGTYVGVAPDAQFLALKVCGSDGFCTDSDIIAAIDYAIANGAGVISMSLGGKSLPNDGINAIEFVADQAVERGVTVVSVAGNSGPGTSCIQSPGMAKKIITVGASSDQDTVNASDDTITTYSCRGPSAFGRLDPDVVAPGENIYSTVVGGNYDYLSGTSMAAPHVAGAAALLLEYNSSFTPENVRSLLMHTAFNMSGEIFDKGAGLINVSRAILTTVEATINDDDRWETSVLPGFNASANLTIYNSGNQTLGLNFSIENASDSEQTNNMSGSQFPMPAALALSAGASTTLKLNFSCPPNASPSIYGTTLIITTNDSQTLRIPIVITVPLAGAGLIQGSADDAGSYSTGSNSNTGDTVYYQLKTINGTSMTVDLNWSDSANNLELYLFAPNGAAANYSANSLTTGERVSLSSLDYDTYWIAVHNKAGSTGYNLTVSYGSNLSINPSSWSGNVGGNVTTKIFTITNDAVPKNVSVDVKTIIPADSVQSDHTITMGAAMDLDNYSCSVSWLKSDLNLSLNETRYGTFNLTWTTTNNLDLFLWYWNDDGDHVLEAGEYANTRFSSQHNNHHLQEYWEKIEMADILYYIGNYHDVGYSVCNLDTNQSFSGNFTLYIDFYNNSRWDRASPDLTLLNMSAGEAVHVTVNFNITGLLRGETYDATLEIENYASIPLSISIAGPTAPVLTDPGNYTNSTLVSLNWTASTSNSGISYYTIQYGNDSTFNQKNETNSSATSANVTLSQGDGPYFFRVKAIDNDSLSSAWSNVENITLDTIVPSAPQLISMNVTINDDTPTFSWNNSTDAVSGVNLYELWVSNDSSFGNMDNVYAQHAGYKNQTSATNFTDSYLLDDLYYWKTRAIDNAGNTGNFSPAENFTLKTIFINEFLPNGDEWIELYNIETKNYSLASWTIGSSTANYTLSSTITGGSYLLLNSTTTNIILSDTSDSLNLWNPNGALMDNFTYSNTTTNYSYGRQSDGSATWATFSNAEITPGESNQQTRSIPLVFGWNLISLPLVA